MGEVSKNAVAALAIAAIAVSALGTWLVLDSASATFGGRQMPLIAASAQDSLGGIVNVFVNGTQQAAATVGANPSMGGDTLTGGIVSVFVKGAEGGAE
jgi:hypothetical protein